MCRNEAAGDAMDPAQWGSWLYNSQDIREQMAEAAAAQNAKEAAVVQTPSTVAPTPASLTKVGSVSWDVASQQQDNTSGFEVEAGVADAMKLPPKPRWDPPLVKFEYPNRSVEEACVEDWRADFIKTRQGLRKNLQHELWRRAQVRILRFAVLSLPIGISRLRARASDKRLRRCNCAGAQVCATERHPGRRIRIVSAQ